MACRLAVIAAAFSVLGAVPAEAHYYAGCKGARCKRHVSRPYAGWLKRVRWCESTDNPRAVNPSGTYRGLYQFDLRSWAASGGSGDPVNAGRLEQGFRAVVWLHRMGPGAWPVCG